MSDAIWFYEDNGERKGPVTADFLLGLSASGAVSGETLVWRDGFADWIPFRESELFDSDSPEENKGAPPMLPPALRVKPAFVPREISFNPNYEFGIRKTLGQGWRLMVSDFWPFVGFLAIMYLILGLVSQLGVTMFFLMYPLIAGYSWWALLRKRGKPAEMDLLFEGFRRQFGPLALANLAVTGISLLVFIVLGIVCMGGCAAVLSVAESSGFGSGSDPVDMVLLVVAALILFLGALIPMGLATQVGYFAILLILEGNLNAGESLSLGWKATKRHWVKFLILSLFTLLMAFVGMCAFYVGAFVTSAWLTLGQVYIYEEAFGDGED